MVAATRDGMTLVYTDSPRDRIGFCDITDPAIPEPSGVIVLAGEPASVDVLGNRYALVDTNTSDDFINPGGELVVVDIATRSVVGSVDPGGQPDSVKISPDGTVINEIGLPREILDCRVDRTSCWSATIARAISPR